MKRTKTMLWSWLVVAAALTTGFTACTNDDPIVGASNELENAQKVQITVGASIADDASTRSAVDISTDANGKKRTLKFTEGDRLYVYNSYGVLGYSKVKGMLTMVENSLSADGKSAQFTGSLQALDGSKWIDSPNFGDEDPLGGTTATLVHKDMVENTDYYFIDYNEIDFRNITAPDVETLMTKNLRVEGGYNSLTKSFALSSNNTIFNCVFTGLTPNTEYFCELQYPVNSGYSLHGGHDFTTDANGVSSHAFCFPYQDGEHEWEIQIRQNGSIVGTIHLGERTLEKKIYNVRRWWNGTAFSAATNLANISSDYVAQNGEMLTGTLHGATQKYKISIADGATVTLSNATINGVHTDDSHELWAGLTCLGDATIILEGANAVQNFNRYYPGLQPGPTGTTLTIRGSGSLTATGREFGTGIGTKYVGGSCGNIRIEGGTVTANGGSDSAGIGASYSSTCGDITITGGTVMANGGSNGAGIGSGKVYGSTSRCGDISITGGTVYATGGYHAAGIGSGNGDGGISQCGSISISGSASVTATGGNFGAGIGTGLGGKCGAISISGGTVMAQGGHNATGIGTGDSLGEEYKAECSDISITKGEGFVSVTAIRGRYASKSIGTRDGSCDTYYKCSRITFDGDDVFVEEADGSIDEPNDGKYGNLYFAKTTTDDGDDKTDDTNNTWTLTPAP